VTTVLAVDLGGTKTAIARVNEDGALADRQTLPAARSVDTSAAQIAGACRDVAAVGIIVPGIYTPATGRAWCPNLWGDGEVPLRQALQAAFSSAGVRPLPIAIDSDRAGYVLGEAWLGAARGLDDVVYVGIGTGIGVGILAGGSIIRGAHGIAGAAGWFALTPDWRESYGRMGCWEAESAGPSVAARAGAPDAQAVVAAARAGDAAAMAILNQAADYTSMGVANLISVFNPEAVVLGGGFMTGARDLLLDRIRSGVARWAQPIAALRCRIEPSSLGEHAGLLGAARGALAARDTFHVPHTQG
jgi:glucokinase